MPEVWEFYRDEVQQLGRRDPGASPIGQNRVVVLAEDPVKGWEQMAPFFLHETNSYGIWQAQDDVASPVPQDESHSPIRDVVIDL